jgi:hypothetical protein
LLEAKQQLTSEYALTSNWVRFDQAMNDELRREMPVTFTRPDLKPRRYEPTSRCAASAKPHVMNESVRTVMQLHPGQL